MGQRLDLHAKLIGALGDNKVYFQPPENIKVEYPCIIYHRDQAYSRFADNNNYTHVQRYQVTVVTYDPDSTIPNKVKALPMCRHQSYFMNDGLNHDVFDLYF